MRSFLDHDNAFTFIGMGLLGIPLIAGIIGACVTPNTPEEKAEDEARYTESIKEDLVVFSPRAGVECYVLRGHTDASPRVMSCVGTIPTTVGQ